MTEPNYSDYFDDRGQPVRDGVQLSPEELAIFREYYPETTNQQTTEETH